MALVALVLGFGLNTIAHVTHAHDATSASWHDVSCGYCLYFGNLAGAPQSALEGLPPAVHTHITLPQRAAIRSRVPERTAQPRAPPLLKT